MILHIKFRRHRYPLTIFFSYSILSTTRLTWYFMYTFSFMWMTKCLSIFFSYSYPENLERASERAFLYDTMFGRSAAYIFLLFSLHLFYHVWMVVEVNAKKKKLFFFYFHEWNLRRDLCFRGNRCFEVLFLFSYFFVYDSYKVALCVCINDYHFPLFTEFQMNIYVFNWINWLRNWNYDAKMAKKKSFGIFVESIEEKICWIKVDSRKFLNERFGCSLIR